MMDRRKKERQAQKTNDASDCIDISDSSFVRQRPPPGPSQTGQIEANGYTVTPCTRREIYIVVSFASYIGGIEGYINQQGGEVSVREFFKVCICISCII